MEITGIIKRIGAIQKVNDKFEKRTFVLKMDGEYPQDIEFQVAQSRMSLIDGYVPFDEIRVHFNLRGRDYTTKEGELRCFNTLDVWKIEGKKGYNNPAAAQPQQEPSDMPLD